MELILIILGIFILNWRTLNYNYLIDDNVRRWEYLYVVPDTAPPAEFYSSKPSPWRHLFLSITHALNVWVIYLLWGWQAAAIFAFHPIAANCTGWITGGYYSVTTFLALTAIFFLKTYPSLIGAGVASLFFTASLGGTITSIGVPFVAVLLMPYGWILFWPLFTYLFGKRFITGFKIRNEGKRDKITWRKPAVMAKVIAYYIRITVLPNKLAFFRQMGFDYQRKESSKRELDQYNKDFVKAVAVIIAFSVIGWQFSPFGTVWFLLTIAPFSQFKLLGQFIAERYLYLPNIGLALIIAAALKPFPYAFTVLLTLYIYRYHLYIPAFKDIESLYKNGIRNYPECVANYCNLGERFLHIKEPLRGLRLFEKALKMDPDCFLAHCNIAAYWITVKNLERAEVKTRDALRTAMDPSNVKTVLGGQLKSIVEHIERKDALDKMRQFRDTGYVEKILSPSGKFVARQETMAEHC